MEKATFAAGCFWGVEAAFSEMEGVHTTEVGYTGGRVDKPTYEDVCSGTTGHAESIQIEFDPEVVSYEQLLERLWEIHDPTTLNRQGPDMGTQYRSAIFFHTPEQEEKARSSIQQLEQSGQISDPVVTEVRPASHFWRAEEYHQKYLEKKGRA